MSIRKDYKIKQIISEVAREVGVDEETVYHILNNQFACVAEAITNNQDITLPRFGSFKIKAKRRLCLRIEKELGEQGKSDEEIQAVKDQVILNLRGKREKSKIRTIKIGKR